MTSIRTHLNWLPVGPKAACRERPKSQVMHGVGVGQETPTAPSAHTRTIFRHTDEVAIAEQLQASRAKAAFCDAVGLGEDSAGRKGWLGALSPGGVPGAWSSQLQVEWHPGTYRELALSLW